MVISNQVRSKRNILLSGIVFVLAVTAAGLTFQGQPSRAQGEWTWTDAPAQVFSSDPIADMSVVATCPTSYRTKSIAGELATKKVCITSGETVNFGLYRESNYFVPVVSFGYDTMMYKLKDTVCSQFDDCAYIPESDILITRQFVSALPVRSLIIYKNFSERLTQKLSDTTPNVEYRFNYENPDYVFESTEGYDWPIGGFGASKNGEWLAVEFRQRGIGLLNTETLTMKRVSTMAFSYGTGHDPWTQLSVSNDGGYVVVGGVNAGLTMFAVDSSCGDEATDFRMANVYPIANRCRGAQIDPSLFIDRFRDGLHPRFNEDGAELSFYATSYNDEQKAVILHASGYTVPRLDYLALGDSFTSGEGETDDTFYLDGTNDLLEKCHVSKRSYPFLIAAAMNIEPSRVKSVACSGATTEDIIGEDRNYWGQAGRLIDNPTSPNKIQKTLNQSSASESFIPGRIHQIRFVERYRPSVITIGIGGNDVGFMDKLRTCIGTGTCEWAETADGRTKTMYELQGLFTKLYDTYSAATNASPRSKVYAVGYPKVIDPKGTCDPLHSSLLNETEREFMDEGITYINHITRAAALKAGIGYIDLQDSLGNQVLCGSGHPSAMNGVRLGDDSSLGADEANWPKFIGNEGFHPKPEGHLLEATTILENISNFSTHSYCLDSLKLCPSDQILPDPSYYWLQGSTTDERQIIGEFVSPQSLENSEAVEKSIQIKSHTFLADSTLTAELHSEPISLGRFSANENGGASFVVTFPSATPAGFHTIHLYGTSWSGESIDLYQVFLYLPTPSGQQVPQNDIPKQQTQPLPPQENTTSSSLDLSEPQNTSNEEVTDTTTQASQTTQQNGSIQQASNPPDINTASTLGNYTSYIASVINDSGGIIIPGIAWLFFGTSVALYVRYRRGK